MHVLNDLLLDGTTVALSQNSEMSDLRHMVMGDITATIVGANAANKTFVDGDVNTATDVITVPAHGYTTGTLVTLTTSGILPAGLALATNYYVVSVTANTLKLAASQALALLGTVVDITAAIGTGTHTINVVAALAGTIKLQKTNSLEDASPIWFDIVSSSQAFSAAGDLNWPLVDIGYQAVRAVAAVTSGTVTLRVRINAKGV